MVQSWGGVTGRMWGSVVLMLSQWACVVGNSVGRARIGACRCQVDLVRSEYRLCKLWAGVYRKKYIPGFAGSSRAEPGHEHGHMNLK